MHFWNLESIESIFLTCCVLHIEEPETVEDQTRVVQGAPMVLDAIIFGMTVVQMITTELGLAGVRDDWLHNEMSTGIF